MILIEQAVAQGISFEEVQINRLVDGSVLWSCINKIKIGRFFTDLRHMNPQKVGAYALPILKSVPGV